MIMVREKFVEETLGILYGNVKELKQSKAKAKKKIKSDREGTQRNRKICIYGPVCCV